MVTPVTAPCTACFRNADGLCIRGNAMDIDIPWFEENILLHKLDTGERQLLQDVFAAVEYTTGDEIVSQGVPAGGIFILRSGSAAVTCKENGQSIYLGEAEEGALFGEMTFLAGGVASATVTAHSRCTIYRMDRDGYYKLIVKNQEMLICLFTYMLNHAAVTIQRMNQQHMQILRNKAMQAS
jgi:CRP-like cAMP-binding protein